jgi:hypothetical protein
MTLFKIHERKSTGMIKVRTKKGFISFDNKKAARRFVKRTRKHFFDKYAFLC